MFDQIVWDISGLSEIYTTRLDVRLQVMVALQRLASGSTVNNITLDFGIGAGSVGSVCARASPVCVCDPVCVCIPRQIIGAHGQDRLTITAAQCVEAALGGWVPPKLACV